MDKNKNMKQQAQTTAKEKNRYIFPSKLAKVMKKIDLRAQLEASMMSMSLLMVGMILYMLYLLIYDSSSLWQRGMLIFNMLCGFVFMGTFLITSYQQYTAYMDTLGIDSDAESELVKKKGNIFERIKLAWQERKRAKQAEKTLGNLGALMKKSGIASEMSDEDIENLIDEGVNSSKEPDEEPVEGVNDGEEVIVTEAVEENPEPDGDPDYNRYVKGGKD